MNTGAVEARLGMLAICTAVRYQITHAAPVIGAGDQQGYFRPDRVGREADSGSPATCAYAGLHAKARRARQIAWARALARPAELALGCW